MIHDLTLAYRMKMQIVVIPAWMAGTEVRKDASGDIRVGLDSSSPCWNDVIEKVLELTEAPPGRIFKGGHEGHEENNLSTKAESRKIRKI